MRAEFFREDDPGPVIGTALWDGHRVRVESDDDEVRRMLERMFRRSPVDWEDRSASDPGGGPEVAEPGDLHWFRAAALVRGRREGLRVRFVTDAPGGWDPAGSYRPLEAWVNLREGGGPPSTTLGTSRA